METKILLVLGNAVTGFLIACVTGNVRWAIFAPSCAVGLYISLPMLFEKNSFGPIEFLVFFILSSAIYGVGAVAGSFLGISVRSSSKSNPKRPAIQLLAAIGILIIMVAFAAISIVKERKLESFGAMAESSGASFLRQQAAVLSITGPVIQTSVFSRGRNQYGLPLIQFYVKGSQGEADVQVEASGTEETPAFSVRAVWPRPGSQANSATR